MFDTYSILLVVAIALSLISLRYRNILFALGGVLGWVSLWAWHADNPPTGITQGSFVHEVLMYAYIVMAIAVVFIYIKNRDRGYTGYDLTKFEQNQLEDRQSSRRPARGLLDLDTNEYRAVIHSRMRNRRRR